MRFLIPYLIVFFISNCFEPLNAQQIPLFAQYREMQGIVNPASISRDFIKFEHNISAGLSYRRQWMEDPQAPATLMANAEWLRETGGSHIISGLYIVDDKLGKESTMGVYQRLGVLISGDPKEYGIALGLNGGMVRYRVRLSETTARDPEPGIGADRQKWHPDIGAGVFAYSNLGNEGHLLYGGFSMPQVLGLKAIQLRENLDIVRYRHYFLTGGYILPFNNEGSDMELSTWTKFVPHTRPNIDLNLRFNYNNSVQLGFGFNTNKSLSFEAAYTLGDSDNWDVNGLWRFGYSYNLNLSSIASYMGNSHEFHFSIAFGGD